MQVLLSHISMALSGKRSDGHKTQAQSKAQDADASSGYTAPVMPSSSVDIFSGLDLPGFAADAVQQHAAQTQPAQPVQEKLVERNVRCCLRAHHHQDHRQTHACQ